MQATIIIIEDALLKLYCNYNGTSHSAELVEWARFKYSAGCETQFTLGMLKLKEALVNDELPWVINEYIENMFGYSWELLEHYLWKSIEQFAKIDQKKLKDVSLLKLYLFIPKI